MAVRVSQVAQTIGFTNPTSNVRVSQLVITTGISLSSPPVSPVLTIRFAGVKIYPEDKAGENGE